jgi:hypothetical protein
MKGESMLPKSNARTQGGQGILLLANWRFPEGDWEIVRTLFETNDKFFIVHLEAAGTGHPFRTALYEPFQFVTRQMLIDLYQTYFVGLHTCDKGFVELGCFGNPPTTMDLEAARQMALEYAT